MEIVNAASLLDLPDEVLLDILSYLNFDDIAKLRPVCTRINDACVRILNKAFQKTCAEQRKLLATFKPYSGMFYSCRYRVRLLRELQKTLGYYVQHGYCAFYAGKVLDMSHGLTRRCPYSYGLPFVNHHEFSKLVRKAIAHFTNSVQPRFKRAQFNLRDPKKSHSKRKSQRNKRKVN